MLIKTDRETIGSYFEDSSNVKGGWADAVLFPESAEDVSEFLAKASREKTPVSISGGGTGTTGARVPFGGIVVSLEKLNRILDIRRDAHGDGFAGVQAGVLVDDLKKAAESQGLFYTCHPTEKTATLGGTIATNASGSRSFRYGPTRKCVRSLMVVLPTGEIAHINRGEKVLTTNDPRWALDGGKVIEIPLPSYTMPTVKNAAGYYAKDGMDVIDLFIGQEGTLGVVVEAAIDLVRRPDDIFSCFAFFARERDSWYFAQDLKSLRPLSIEYFDRNSLILLRSRDVAVPAHAQAAIFFENDVRKESADETVVSWQRFLKKYHVSEDDVWAAFTEKEAEKFTEFRHSIPSAINEILRGRAVQKLATDIAVPDDKLFEMMDFYAESFKNNDLEHVIFGHIGESHVHANILPRSDDEREAAKAYAMQFVRKGIALGGTVSAEHGIGKIKHAYLEALYGRKGLLEMVRIKKALDPACILGLDNIFPKELLNAV